MPRHGKFGVDLVVNGRVLDEVVDTKSSKCYGVARAGDEYIIRLSGDAISVYGAIIQIDGTPKEADFPKSPFTYFRNPYSDPGFWIKPSEGKYAPRKFTQPAMVEQGGENTTTDEIGRIRVYFFEVEPKQPSSSGRVYDTPSATKVAESKKWYLASNATRYGTTRESGQKGGGYQIKDRASFLEVIEMWYKDSTSLELLGWDKTAPSFEFQLPWQRAKDEAASKDPAKRTVSAVIDLTLESDDDEKEEERRKKAKVETLVVE